MQLLASLVIVLSLGNCHALYCWVGSGNSSVVLPEDYSTDTTKLDQMMTDNELTDHNGFASKNCEKSKEAVLNSLEDLQKKAMSKIQEALNALKNIAGGSRKKRSENADAESESEGEAESESSDNYACIKITTGGKTYRSCAPKVDGVKLECSGGSGNSICYCHDNNCNGASMMEGLGFSSFIFLLAALNY